MKPKIPFDDVDFDEEKFIKEYGKQFDGWDIYWDVVFCCGKGKLTLLKWLLDDCNGYYYDDPRKHGFLDACEYGHLNIVKWLAFDDYCGVPPLENMEGLRDALINGHTDIVEWFLSLPDYYTELNEDCKDNEDEILYLLEKRNDLMNEILEVLCSAVDESDEHTIEWLNNYMTNTIKNVPFL